MTRTGFSRTTAERWAFVVTDRGMAAEVHFHLGLDHASGQRRPYYLAVRECGSIACVFTAANRRSLLRLLDKYAPTQEQHNTYSIDHAIFYD